LYQEEVQYSIFSTDFRKQEALRALELNGNNVEKTAREFNVEPQTVRQWRKDRETIKDTKKVYVKRKIQHKEPGGQHEDEEKNVYL
jgi:transposase-like protein